MSDDVGKQQIGISIWDPFFPSDFGGASGRGYGCTNSSKRPQARFELISIVHYLYVKYGIDFLIAEVLRM